jgi:hypothetical protein
VQLHIGVRYLLLAPLYGYAFKELRIESGESELSLLHDGLEENYSLLAFRARIRTHVREDLERVTRPAARSAIDLSRVGEAEQASSSGDHVRVLELLGAWPAPLAIFLRTPEGQMLNAETRAVIARALALLGGSCMTLGEVGKGEEILRLGIQYAADGVAAPEVFLKLGEVIFSDGRTGEAIGPLRRAANLGAPAEKVWPLLAEAFVSRGRFLAAIGAAEEAKSAGVPADELEPVLAQVRAALGAPYERYCEALESAPK